MVLEFNSLTKRFGPQTVIDGISVKLETNSLALIGSSGGGKSTLLRMMGGLIRATSGEILINGIKVPDEENELIRHRSSLGYVFQQGSLFKHLSAKENIALVLREVHGWTKEDADDRAMDLLGRFGLKEHAQKRPAELSGGQQQRAAIARAIAPRPKLLLLDEPTSALDPEYTAEVLDLVAELQKEGIEFVIVTHEMGFARRACAHTMFLHAGRIVEHGPSQTVFGSPRTSELKKFLGKLLEWNG